MWRRIECTAIYTENVDQSIAFYESVGLIKTWDTFQNAEKTWRLVGMRFPEGGSELVLKDNPTLKFAETEIAVDDVNAFYEKMKENPEIEWIRTPFPNALGGHVAVMKAPDENVFVLIGK